MKIAVTAKGSGLGAWLDPVFEESRQLVPVSEKGRFESWGQDDASWPDPQGAARVAWLVGQEPERLSQENFRRKPEIGSPRRGSFFHRGERVGLDLVEAAREGILTRLASPPSARMLATVTCGGAH